MHSHPGRPEQPDSDFYAMLLTMAGHDLRNQLQLIASANRALEKSVLSGPEKLYLEHSKIAATQISRQLEGILAAARLYQEHSGITLAVVSLVQVLAALEKDVREAAGRKGIQLAVETADISILSNIDLLMSILRNLTHNAVKYTAAGGRVTVACSLCGESARIDVSDTGIGIPAEHLAKVFNAFHRVDDANTDGLGLGLFITKRAAHLLGHAIDVDSEPGRGSRFSVTAPLAS